MKRIRVLLADDHRHMLDVIALVLEPEFDIVGAVTDGQAALDAAAALAPDVVVLDVSMPRLSGIEAAQRLTKSGSPPAIVVLTMHNDPELVAEAFRVGALGYVLKDRGASDLARAIREALAGRHFVSST